jgi:hypothetical protein
VAGADGKVHIVCELVLTNMTPAKLRIDAVQVRNAHTQRVLLSLLHKSLAADVRPVGGAEASAAGDSEDLATERRSHSTARSTTSTSATQPDRTEANPPAAHRTSVATDATLSVATAPSSPFRPRAAESRFRRELT